MILNRNRTVRLVASVDSPLVNECFDLYPNSCRDPGFEAEFAYSVVHDLLKLPVQWIRADSYDDVTRHMDEGSADMIAISMMIDSKLGRKWGYSPPYIWDGVGLFVKETIIDTSESALLLRQFTKELWGTLLLGTLLVVILHWIANKVYKRYQSTKNYNNASKFINYSIYFSNNSVYALWFLFITIILNFYSNLMAVDLLHSSKQKTVQFNSMDELGDKLLKNECQLALYNVYFDMEEMQTAVVNPNHNRSWAMKFRKAYNYNKPIYTSSREELGTLILNSSCVVGLDWITIKSYFTSRFCNMRMISYPDEKEMLYQYTFYSTWPELRDAVNTVIDSDAFQAFPDILTNKYYFSGGMPACENVDAVNVSPLTLNKLQDGFYALFIGLAVAFYIVLYQNCKGGHNRVRKIFRILCVERRSYCCCKNSKLYTLENFKI